MARRSRKTESKKAWHHACAVAGYNEEFSGLNPLIISCYHFHMESLKEYIESYLNSLLIARVLIFFEVLRIMCELKYKKQAPSDLKEKINKLEDIKKSIVPFRSELAKLKSHPSQKKSSIIIPENRKIPTPKDRKTLIFFIHPDRIDIDEYSYSYDKKTGIYLSDAEPLSINIQELFNEFLLILGGCQISKYGEEWLASADL